jgi:hypothetical protein
MYDNEDLRQIIVKLQKRKETKNSLIFDLYT